MSLQNFLRKNATEYLSYIFPVAVFVSIFATYFNYVPLWDGRAYLNNCVLAGVANPFHLMTFNCTNHGALFYGLLYALMQYINFGNVVLIHLTSLVLLLSAFCFLYAILKILFADKVWVMMGMAAVCWNPVVIANAINPTPDLVVFALSLMSFWCFLTFRVILASIFGFALLFSKEAGVVYYALCCFFYLLYYSQAANQWKFNFKQGLILTWPFLIYGYFMWFKTHVAFDHLLFNNIRPAEIFQQIFIDWREPHFYSAINTIFVLNFQWVILLIFVMKVLFFRPQRVLAIAHEIKTILFISLLLVSSIYIFCQFPHVLNVRYYLLVFPLIAWLFIFTLKSLPRYWGAIIGVIFIILSLASCFKTIDPVSKSVYGTFQFGRHPMLNMTSETLECCGYGRDQLVYNLEHAKLATLLNQFSRKLQIGESDIILTHPLADYYIYGNLTNETHQWTLKVKDTHVPLYANDPRTIQQSMNNKKITRIFYIEFPNVEDTRYARQVLAYFKPLVVHEIKDHGYIIKVTELASQ